MTEATNTPDIEAPRLAPGTYELTKRIEVGQDGTYRFVDMPDGPDAEYVKGFWHKTRSQVRQVDPDRASVSHITDDMVERATEVVERGHAYLSCRDLARDVLSAALAGCTIVALPEADDMVTFTNRRGDQQQAAWKGPDDYGLIYPIVWRPPLFNHEPHVETPTRSFSADDAERLGLQLIAAAREARRLAGSVSPKGDDTE